MGTDSRLKFNDLVALFLLRRQHRTFQDFISESLPTICCNMKFNGIICLLIASTFLTAIAAANIKANVHVKVGGSGTEGPEEKPEPNCVKKGGPCSWAACCPLSGPPERLTLECKRINDTEQTDPDMGKTFCMPCKHLEPCNPGPICSLEVC